MGKYPPPTAPKDVCAFCFYGEKTPDGVDCGKYLTSSLINAHHKCMKFNPRELVVIWLGIVEGAS